MVPGRPALQGRDTIAAWLGEFGAAVIEIRTGVTEFLASDRLAYATGAMVFSARDLRDPRVVHSFTGQHVTLLLREGRTWRIHSQVLAYRRQDEASRRGGGPVSGP